MRVRFIPNGGTRKRGAFIEYDGEEPEGNEVEYQRHSGRISIETSNCRSEFIVSIGPNADQFFKNEKNEEDPDDDHLLDTDKDEVGGLLLLDGRIEDDFESPDEIHVLGREIRCKLFNIVIRETKEFERVELAGPDRESNFYPWKLLFSVWLRSDRFSRLATELEVNGKCLVIDLDMGFFSFVSEDMPPIGAPEVLKYIESPGCGDAIGGVRVDGGVKNPEDVPRGYFFGASDEDVAVLRVVSTDDIEGWSDIAEDNFNGEVQEDVSPDSDNTRSLLWAIYNQSAISNRILFLGFIFLFISEILNVIAIILNGFL